MGKNETGKTTSRSFLTVNKIEYQVGSAWELEAAVSWSWGFRIWCPRLATRSKISSHASSSAYVKFWSATSAKQKSLIQLFNTVVIQVSIPNAPLRHRSWSTSKGQKFSNTGQGIYRSGHHKRRDTLWIETCAGMQSLGILKTVKQ